MVVYAPHTLFVREERVVRDEHNQTLFKEKVWRKLGSCRCDDNTTEKIVDEAGQAYVPKYHIVSSRLDVKAGDYVRAQVGDVVRGEGEVKRVIKTNYLDYMSIYV